MKKLILLATVFMIMLVTVSCGGSQGNEDKISIRGSITKVTTTNDKDITLIFVEGQVESDTLNDKASVKIDGKTKIYRAQSTKKLPVSEIKEGQKVEINFEGPVLDSYPVQATAGTIRIIE